MSAAAPDHAQVTEDEVRAVAARLFEAYYHRVRRYMTARLGRCAGADAEGLASEVFVRALRALRCAEPRPVPTREWLFTIAHNLEVDLLRKDRVRPRLISLDDVYNLAGHGDTAGAAEARIGVEALTRALAFLTPLQRDAVALRYWGHLPVGEVASVLHQHPGAVRQAQSMARKRLRQLCSPAGGQALDPWSNRTRPQEYAHAVPESLSQVPRRRIPGA